MIGKEIPIPYMNIATSLVSFTVPLLLGVAFKHKWPKKALVLSKRVNLKFLETFLISTLQGVQTILPSRPHHSAVHTHLVQLPLIDKLRKIFKQKYSREDDNKFRQMTKYRFNLYFFYLCSWRHLVSGVALGFLGYILGALFATIARFLYFSM